MQLRTQAQDDPGGIELDQAGFIPPGRTVERYDRSRDRRSRAADSYVGAQPSRVRDNPGAGRKLGNVRFGWWIQPVDATLSRGVGLIDIND